MFFVILLLTIFSLLGYFSWKSLYGVYSYWRSRGIPIAPGCLPIVGHMGPVIASRESFAQLVDRCYKMFPNNSMVGFNHSGSHTLIVREPELVKTVLQSNFSSFHTNKVRINPELDPLLANHPFFTSGEIWSTGRKNLTYAFSSMRLKILAETVREVSDRFKDYLDNKLKKHDTVELELKDVFSRFTGETIANVGFGVQGFCFQDEYHPMSFRNPADEIFAPSITQILPMFFPKLSKYIGIRFVPKKIDCFFRELVRQIIDERKRSGTPRRDFVQLILDRAQSEGVEVDIDRLTGDAFTFYIDGHETSNTTLSLTGFQLASNPGIQQKLREHVLNVLEKHHGVINFESLKDMTYLDQVINEAMRRTPALHILLKMCTEEFELRGSDGVSCRVKPGTEIIIPVYGIQNDPKYWPDPKVFNPDRFAPDKKDGITKFSFLPFGDGPRICVGMRMALLQMKAALATMYDVLLSIMQDDLRQGRTAEEEAIKKHYAKNAGLFIKIYTVLMTVTLCGMTLSGFVPQFLDLLIPLNETRKRQLLFDVEIFVDQKDYFYLIYFFESYGVFMVCFLVGVSENMFVIFVEHISGMFAVIGHQLNNLTNVEDCLERNKVDINTLVTRRLHACIKKHQKSLQFADLIDEFYDFPVTLTLVSTFCALTVSLVQVTDPQLITVKMVLFTTMQIVQLFIISCMGQNLINASEQIFEDAYSANWYVCSPELQKLIQLIILRSSRPCKIVPRRMYTLSVENFLAVIQTVVSCFMVLRQSR